MLSQHTDMFRAPRHAAFVTDADGLAMAVDAPVVLRHGFHPWLRGDDVADPSLADERAPYRHGFERTIVLQRVRSPGLPSVRVTSHGVVWHPHQPRFRSLPLPVDVAMTVRCVDGEGIHATATAGGLLTSRRFFYLGPAASTPEHHLHAAELLACYVLDAGGRPTHKVAIMDTGRSAQRMNIGGRPVWVATTGYRVLLAEVDALDIPEPPLVEVEARLLPGRWFYDNSVVHLDRDHDALRSALDRELDSPEHASVRATWIARLAGDG